MGTLRLGAKSPDKRGNVASSLGRSVDGQVQYYRTYIRPSMREQFYRLASNEVTQGCYDEQLTTKLLTAYAMGCIETAAIEWSIVSLDIHNLVTEVLTQHNLAVHRRFGPRRIISTNQKSGN